MCKVHCKDWKRKFEISPKLCLAYEKKTPEENRFQTLQSVDFKSLPQYHSLSGNTVVHQEKITSYYICIDPMFVCIRLVTACPTFYNDGILSVSNLIHGSWKAYQNVVFLFLKLDFAVL